MSIARRLAACAAACVITVSGVATASAGTIVDTDGTTVNRTGSVSFTAPKVVFIPDDSSYGPVIAITWTINNQSNAHVKGLGSAYWGKQVEGRDVQYVDDHGQEMLMNCSNAAVPFAPGESGINCTQYRQVTPAELEAGKTLPDTPRYHVLYGLNTLKGEREWVTAAPVPSIPLPEVKPTPQPTNWLAQIFKQLTSFSS